MSSLDVYVSTWEDTAGTVDAFVVAHECSDECSIASGTKDEAIQELAQFIAEAQDAMTRLEALEVCEHAWQDEGKENIHNGGTNRLFRCSKCNATVWKVVDRSTAQPWYAAQYYR